MQDPAIDVHELSYRYGTRAALDRVSFTVARGEIFGVLGPNGGGKTTLFRVLSTLLRPATGDARIFGASVGAAAHAVRRHLGVVFQQPSVDGKLSVRENLWCHGRLYGLDRGALRRRIPEVLERLGLAERAADRVEILSGGLQRRVELAKALLHAPRLLLLDEPSTGLDPGARRDFFQYLHFLRARDGLTAVLTTHATDEGERCDRVAILDRGRLVGIGPPAELKAGLGGDVVVLHTPDPGGLSARIRSRFGHSPQVVDGTVRVELPRGHDFVRAVVEAFPADILQVSYGKPTLEDVFVHLTGHRFWTDGGPAEGSR